MGSFNSKILIIGKSGSGKDYLANLLCSKTPFFHLSNNKGVVVKPPYLSQIISYTTRTRRPNEKDTHIFVEQFDPNTETIAQTTYHGHKYWATYEQLVNNDIYIIDPQGAIDLYFKQGYKFNLLVLYLDVPWYIRWNRIRKRNSWLYACKRIFNDWIAFKSMRKVKELYGINHVMSMPNCNNTDLAAILLTCLRQFYPIEKYSFHIND